MSFMRSFFLWASRNERLRESLPRFRFVRKAVKRFLPGESIEDALTASEELREKGISTIVTFLGENVSLESEARKTTEHYLEVLDKIQSRHLDCYISLKLTQLGFDLGEELCYKNLTRIVERAEAQEMPVWVDMEGSVYTQSTIELYRRVRGKHPNVGICLQSYLYRTQNDLDDLLAQSAAIRLVKGAYAEPREIAIPDKKVVNETFFDLSQKILKAGRRGGLRPAIATHDPVLIRRITDALHGLNVSRDDFEFQMLYGIQREQQLRLASEGYRVRVLISYGRYWYPWYMRRLAERPANVFFVLKNIFSR
jgi:proline dehydrogenase